jgi:hypothetical protein
MMLAVVALALAQCPPYVRTKVSDTDPFAHSLYWREKTQIQFVINGEGNPETTGDSEFTAVERAFGTWQAQFDLCGSLSFKEGPRTNSRLATFDSKSSNNQNVVLWRFKSCGQIVSPTDPCIKDENCGNKYDCWQHNPGALAITTTSYDPMTGRILDADIELNTPSFIFTTVDAPPCVKPVYNQNCVASDVQNTVTHEVGHMIGLAHDCMPSSTMYLSANPGELTKRALDDGSKRFVCDTYPKDGPSTSGILLSVDPKLGTVARGCVAAPGTLWAALALLGLWRKRRE